MAADAGEPETFEQAVHRIVAAVAAGVVVTYGEVAVEAGCPGAARAVGRIMAGSDGALPWWRVVTADGRLVPGHEAEHRRRLRAEGVDVGDRRVRGMLRPDGGGPGRRQ